MTDQDRDAQKGIEFYAASVAAWYTSSLEYDKSLFALSGGGIALLVTLLTTVGFSSWLALGLFLGAIACYLVCLGALLTIFRKNPKYLESILTKSGPAHDPLLRLLDLVALVGFAIGTVLGASAGVISALDSFAAKKAEREKSMATDSKPAQVQPLDKSFTGAANLQVDGRRSYSGAGNLQPGASSPAFTPTVAPTPTAPSSAPASAPQTPGGTK